MLCFRYEHWVDFGVSSISDPFQFYDIPRNTKQSLFCNIYNPPNLNRSWVVLHFLIESWSSASLDGIKKVILLSKGTDIKAWNNPPILAKCWVIQLTVVKIHMISFISIKMNPWCFTTNINEYNNNTNNEWRAIDFPFLP